ncbi:MAG: zinc ribbon domain-containing protein [Ruminococcaceae bacterium]|nr:zinc ribbon domain-containing protein [Oscillospiraceae bacterium]
MGFLDDAINKTKEVFDVACQKTGEVVTTEKQKFNIASLKSKREKDFADLGRIYFELVKKDNDLDDETRNLVDAIIEKNEEIARLNADIQNIKNKRVCPRCSANIDINSAFCNSCGAKLD